MKSLGRYRMSMSRYSKVSEEVGPQRLDSTLSSGLAFLSHCSTLVLIEQLFTPAADKSYVKKRRDHHEKYRCTEEFTRKEIPTFEYGYGSKEP
jgi:hypothetical protein